MGIMTEMDFQSILSQMLARVPDNIDKREGSIIYDALAPAAVELQLMYIEIERVMNETFADTASREYLIKRAKERGIVPFPATKAVLKGVFNQEIAIGERFSLEGMHYAVIEKISDFTYKMECETKGTAGNKKFGDLIPVHYIEGLSIAKLTELLIPGEEEEETEKFRNRYFLSLDSQAFGGNIQDYKQKVNAMVGVGGTKIFPVWNGGGTVKVVIINSDFDIPSLELIEEVQTILDPEQNQGKGLGIAPIGHVVTVRGVTKQELKIDFEITYESGWSWEGVKERAESAIDDYLLGLRKEWEESKTLTVRISQIETRLLDLEGILDIGETRINGMAKNFVMDQESIPVRGSMGERQK